MPQEPTRVTMRSIPPTHLSAAGGSERAHRATHRRRVSTARPGTNPMFGHLVGEMPVGLILNIGSGTTSKVGTPQVVVNVDHVVPERATPGPFVVADARHLPFAAGVFAGVVAKDVLEHVDDPIGVLAELRRACRSGGRLLVIVPRAIPRAVWDDPTHIRGFTERALVTSLTLSGWRLSAPVRRLGGLPGAGRLGMTPHLESIMRIPGLGHWFGRNWIARATLDPHGALP